MSKERKRRGVSVGAGMVPTSTEIGRIVRERRIELGLSQTELNSKIPRSGIKNQLVSKLEVGSLKSLRPDQLKILTKILNLDASSLSKCIKIRTPRQRTRLGKLIRSLCAKQGLSTEQFALQLGLTTKQVRAIEFRNNLSTCYRSLLPIFARILSVDEAVFAPFLGLRKKESGLSKFGKSVRSHRIRIGMSARRLARELHVTHQAVSSMERRGTPYPKRFTIEKLAGVLQTSVEELTS